MPENINRIGLDCDQFGTNTLARTTQMFGLLDSMQMRVIGQLLARFQIVMNPADNRFIDQMSIFVNVAVDLLTDLNGVTTINKHGGLVGKHHRRPGRPGKTGQPCQTFGTGRNIFALMFI